MNYAVIDIGSNSVRMLLNGRKTTVNTQLAEKANAGGFLLPTAMARTAEAVISFVEQAKEVGATPKVFATEAVRSARNKEEFLNILLKNGVTVDVLAPETEAKIGFDGAYSGNGQIQAVLDVGGASSELAVGDGKTLYYSHSLPIGAVRLKDFSDDKAERTKHAHKLVKEYGEVPTFSELVTIGGTTSSLVAVRDGIDPYDPQKVHLQKLTLTEIDETVNKILATPPEERTKIKGLHPKKIHILPAGGILVMEIMRYLGVTAVTVSEKDNLEGYISDHS